MSQLASCRKIMETGVADGENAETMVEAAAQSIPLREVEYYGFDLFIWSRLGQVKQKMKEMGCKFKLFKGDTVKTLPKTVKQLPKSQLDYSVIYVNHSDNLEAC